VDERVKIMAEKKVRYRAMANPERNQAMLELRRSSATEPQADRRTRRARSRHAQRAKAISAQY
tara:strand:+ start:3767 stop:3955 length:189 start_codon:yes stop_codon:yes gene_type:complete